ncbi:MAG: hypothetical protein NC080_05165 [Paraprevotella sp.]|nr:hypothetical protein [Paraprevotella sp.]
MSRTTGNRVSGIMRVKNDGMFIEACIESCIDALDELIVVHNDCTDNSVEEIERMKSKYPHKIKRYEYPHKIYGVGLTKKEYDIAKALPDDSPNLLCTYYNFALSKVTSQYAMKIDADQVYFTDTLKHWCDFIRQCKPQRISVKVMAGKAFCMYISLYRYLSARFQRVLPLAPMWLLDILYPYYLSYARHAFSHGKACFSLSGVNVLYTDETILIPMGHKVGDLVSGIPFNGEGDTVIFKVSNETFFSKMPDYTNGGGNLSIIEQFNHPYRLMHVGFFWKHLRAMRPASFSNAMNLLKVDPEAYIDIDRFQTLSYDEIINRTSSDVFRLFQKVLFCFIYKANKRTLFDALKR